MRRSSRLICGSLLAALALAAPLLPAAVQAQQDPQRALESSGSPFNLEAVRALLARGDAAAANGNGSGIITSA